MVALFLLGPSSGRPLTTLNLLLLLPGLLHPGTRLLLVEHSFARVLSGQSAWVRGRGACLELEPRDS